MQVENLFWSMSNKSPAIKPVANSFSSKLNINNMELNKAKLAKLTTGSYTGLAGNTDLSETTKSSSKSTDPVKTKKKWELQNIDVATNKLCQKCYMTIPKGNLLCVKCNREENEKERPKL